MLNIIAHTDGACSGNPGVGGYCAILTANGVEKIVRGHSSKVTTNNQMELRAVIEVIEWLNKVQKKPCCVEIHTDSKYIVDCTNTKMKDGSKKTRKWFEGRPNEEMWLELIDKGNKGGHKIRFVKVKGHSGDIFNERCDRIAKEECVIARHELYEND